MELPRYLLELHQTAPTGFGGLGGAGAVPNRTIGVNLVVFHGILGRHFYKCRPYGAWLLWF